MPLGRYCNKRMVAQDAATSAYEAVRAMQSNHIGCIVVLNDGEVCGIATDRDLAQRVIGLELDPKKTPLKDVMTPEPITATVDDTEEQVVAAMRASHVRRIPVVEGKRPVGMVTVDDLVIAGAITWRELAELVQSQLMEPAPHKPAGIIHPIDGAVKAASERRSLQGPALRQHHRKQQRLLEFAVRVQSVLQVDDREQALMAFEVFASNLARRMLPQEAKDFASQLPATLGDQLLELPPGPDRKITRAGLEQEMARTLNIKRSSAAYLVQQLGAALNQFISSGEIEDMKAQLPPDLRGLLP